MLRYTTETAAPIDKNENSNPVGVPDETESGGNDGKGVV
jgi:hypothetical protein